ncbi:MAG: 50S ribosome-binding GTPase [Thermoanaerobacteraceae bacterium]|nr:50S ribosome-binding GTPase [Thermoanaerobacteraceae bacterium]
MVAKKILIAGKTNVGKSSLALTLARFLGVYKFHVCLDRGTGEKQWLKYDLAMAKRKLVSSREYYTQGLNTYYLEISKVTRWQLIDSTGLSEDIHTSADLRRGMALTIAALADCDCLLHVLDAEKYSVNTFSAVDDNLAAMGSSKPYIAVANKIDSVDSSAGLKNIQRRIERVIPCSTLTGEGIVSLRQLLLDKLKQNS